MPRLAFLDEVRRRKVFRTAAAYLAGSFVLLQVADLTFDSLGFSHSAYRALIVICAVGFPFAILLSWLFELRAERPSATDRRYTIIMGSIVLVAASGLAAFAIWRWPAPTNASPQLPVEAKAALDSRDQEAVVRARYHLAKTSPAELDSAVAILEELTAREPRFARGHALLGLAYMYQYSMFRAYDQSLEQKALLASERALALDEGIPEAHVVRGRMLWTPTSGFAHEQAVAEYKRALELDPGNAEAWFQLGQVYAHVGLLDRAIAAYDSSISLNALDPRARTWRGQALLYQGKFADALDILLAAPKAYNPTMVGYQIAWAQYRLNRRSDAERTLRHYLTSFDDDAGALTSMSAVLLASKGDAAGAREAIRSAEVGRRGSIHFHHTEFNIGVAHALLGDLDSAVTWLRAAADDGLPCLPLYENNPDLVALRNRPDYEALIADLRRRTAHYQVAM